MVDSLERVEASDAVLPLHRRGDQLEALG